MTGDELREVLSRPCGGSPMMQLARIIELSSALEEAAAELDALRERAVPEGWSCRCQPSGYYMHMECGLRCRRQPDGKWAWWALGPEPRDEHGGYATMRDAMAAAESATEGGETG